MVKQLEQLGIPAPRPEEILQASGFPAPPANVLFSVPYAIEVFLRRRGLGLEIADAIRLERTAKSSVDRADAALGAAVLAVEDSPKLAPIAAELEHARQTQSYSTKRAQTVQTNDAVFAGQRDALLTDLEHMQENLEPLRTEEAALAMKSAAEKHRVERAQAKLSRVDIEARNLSQSPSPQPGRLDALEAEKRARQAELTVAEGPLRDVETQLGAIRLRLSEALERIAAVQGEKRTLEEAMQRDGAQTSGELATIADEHELALRSLGQAATEHGLATYAPIDVANAAADSARAWRSRKRQAAIMSEAASSFDRKHYRVGAAILLAATASIFVMFAVIALT